MVIYTDWTGNRRCLSKMAHLFIHALVSYAGCTTGPIVTSLASLHVASPLLDLGSSLRGSWVLKEDPNGKTWKRKCELLSGLCLYLIDRPSVCPSTVDPKDVHTGILTVAPLGSGDFAVFILQSL